MKLVLKCVVSAHSISYELYIHFFSISSFWKLCSFNRKSKDFHWGLLPRLLFIIVSFLQFLFSFFPPVSQHNIFVFNLMV
jgi:hypothetical protein